MNVHKVVKIQTDKILLFVSRIFFRKITAIDKKKLAIKGRNE